ncbi:hypothetical protein TNCV_346171 [Trichonephila clavipes]|nr:hypothetical protein TNCV_346171 [Trichonephila clavipes]
MFSYVLGMTQDGRPSSLDPLLEKFLCLTAQSRKGGGKAVTPKCLGGPPVDRDRRNAHTGSKPFRVSSVPLGIPPIALVAL